MAVYVGKKYANKFLEFSKNDYKYCSEIFAEKN